MKFRKIFEANELQARAKKHKKKSRGMSPCCSLNPDAGNVQHNVSMFNMMNSPIAAASNNPVSGPHGGDVGGMCEEVNMNEALRDTIDIHYDDLRIERIVQHRRPSSYSFDYDRDDTVTAEDFVSYDYPADKSSVIEFLYDYVDSSDMETINTASDEEIIDFIKLNLEDLLDKYIEEARDYFERYAVEHAEEHIDMNESVDVEPEYVIMAIHNDGRKQYYNRSAVPHWFDKAKDATIFDDMDEARSIWLEIDKRPFKRVFIPNYDHKLMNESAIVPTIDPDKQYLIRLLRDRISWIMDVYVDKYYQTIPHWLDGYKVNTKQGKFILHIEFDTSDPDRRFVFSIDGKPQQVIEDERELAKFIIETARRKYASKFDVAVESVKEEWNPPADWISYKGAWIYPVDGGYEANFTGEHFEAPTIDELKIKLMNARAHRQKFSGYSERDAKFADNIRKFGRELEENYDEPTKGRILDWLEEHDQAYEDAQRFFKDMPLKDVDREDLLSWIEDHKQLFDDFKRFFNNVDEGLLDRHYDESEWEPEDIELHKNTDWKARNYRELPVPEDSFEHEVVAYGLPGGTQRKRVKFIKYIRPNEIFPPYYAPEEDAFEGTVGVMYDGAGKRGKYDIHNRYETQDVYDALSETISDPSKLTDCPACGDVSFDSKRGRCTKCFYRESLDEALEKGEELTLWWKDPSWSKTSPCYASVEYVGRTKDKKYRFKSLTYGWDFILDAKNKTITDHNGKTFDVDNSSGWMNRFDESVNEWYEFSEDDFEDDQMHANVYGGDTKYCKDCGAVKEYDEDGFAFCPDCSKDESVDFDEDDDGKTVSVSFDISAPSNMKDSEIENIIRKAIAATDLDIPGYMEVHVLNEYLQEKLTGYKLTITKDGKTFDDYACAYEEDGAVQQMKNKYGKDIEITSVNVSKVIKEASYGGAYDIADDQYFTREELNEFADRVVSELNETFNDKFEILDASIDDGILTVEIEGNELGWYMEKVRIDMRKIKTPSDLQRVYAPEMISKFNSVIRSYNGIN